MAKQNKNRIKEMNRIVEMTKALSEAKTPEQKEDFFASQFESPSLPTFEPGEWEKGRPNRFDTGEWEKAQIAERHQHKFNYHEGLIHYAKAYKNYFHFVGLGFNLHGLNVIEVGPADFPALGYCHNWSDAIVIEPMPSEHLKRICEEKNIRVFVDPFEKFTEESAALNSAPANKHKTEVWFFNLLQHVADPNEVVEKAKAIADRIRFFEPINEPVTEYHLHSFTIADFHRWFGGCETYTGDNKVAGFHTADCVYGVWHK